LGNIIDALHFGKALERLLDIQNLVFGSIGVEVNADIDFILDRRRRLARDHAKNDEADENEQRHRHDDDGHGCEPAVPPKILEAEMENA
jgi:hypothetical protein